MKNFILIAIIATVVWWATRPDAVSDVSAGTVNLKISGMFCEGCNETVTRILSTLKGVSDIQADFIHETVTFKTESKLTPDEVRQLLAQEDYLLVSMGQ